MGQLDAAAVQPPHLGLLHRELLRFDLVVNRADGIRVADLRVPLRSAVQVACETQALKPRFHLIGSRVETKRLSCYGSAGFNELILFPCYIW
jgi:hypothetical protein